VCRTAVAWLIRLPLMICCKNLCGWRYEHILSMGRRKSIGRTSLQSLVLSISLQNSVETGASAAANAVLCANQDHTGPHISGRRIFLAFVHNTLILYSCISFPSLCTSRHQSNGLAQVRQEGHIRIWPSSPSRSTLCVLVTINAPRPPS